MVVRFAAVAVGLAACGDPTPDERACDLYRDDPQAAVTAATAPAQAPGLDPETATEVALDAGAGTYVGFDTGGDGLVLYSDQADLLTGMRTETADVALPPGEENPSCAGLHRRALALDPGTYLLTLAASADPLWLLLLPAAPAEE